MDYKIVFKQLEELYKKYNNNNYYEIDYVLSEIIGQSNLQIKFCNFTKKELIRAKRIVLKRLKTKKPYQKIFKRAYFYDLSFYVNKNVLTPRPDSEILVENALKENFNTVLDLCCGSGCLGLTIKSKNPNAILTLADISKKALKVSKKNAKQLNISAGFIKTNMFSNIKKKFDLIVCNPPYIETNIVKTLEEEVKNYDPNISLDGGKDGLKFYSIIYDNLENYLNEGGTCFLEIGYNQGHLVQKFKEKFGNVELIKDYNNLDRVIKIKKEKRC